MSYTSPRTWTTDTASAGNNRLNASALNTDIRDNLLSLRGLNDAACRVYLVNSVNLTTAVETVVTWGAASFNIGSMWSSSINPSRLTAPTTGFYEFIAFLSYGNDSTGSRRVSYRVNGTTTYRVASRPAPDAGSAHVPATDIISLTAGDYIEILAFQDSGGTKNLSAGPDSTFAELRLLGDSAAAAWTAPSTGDWQFGTGFTAAKLNEQVRDNVLTLRGMQGYAIKLQLAANLSVANNNGTPVTWTAAQFSIGSGMWSSAVSASEITVPLTGWWEVFGRANWALNTSGRRGVSLNYYTTAASATGTQVTEDYCDAVAATGVALNFSDLLYLTSGIKMTMQVIQQSGGALNLISGTTGSVFGMRLVGTTV